MTGFGDVIGHRHVVAMLEADAARPAHAYLFVGPAAVGKAMAARRFAAALISGGDDAAHARVVADQHPDLTIVEPDGRTALTVERARETVARASRAPIEAERKVFVFEEAGAMNDEAANALLKTLEEPSETTVFLLVAESVDDLPDTIASRCRVVLFGRVGDDEIAEALEGRGVPAEQAVRTAVAAGGRPGLALMLATRPEVAGFREAWLSVPTRLTTRTGDAVALAREMIAAAEPLLEGLDERQRGELEQAEEEGRDTGTVRDRHEREKKRAAAALHLSGLEILASWFRDAAAASYGAPVRNRDVSGTDLAAISPPQAVVAVQRVLATFESLEVNQRPELAFTTLFADLGASG